MVRRSKKSDTVITIDFTGVEGKRQTLPVGDYVLRVDEVTQEVGEKGPYLSWVFVVDEGPSKGSKVWHNTSMTPKSLWGLARLLTALGMEVPDAPLELDTADLPDRIVGGVIKHEEWQGKPKARIDSFFPASSAEEQDDEDDAPPAKAAAAKKGNSLEKTNEAKVRKLDEDGLLDLVAEYKLDVDLDEHATLRRKINHVVSALEAAGYLEE